MNRRSFLEALKNAILGGLVALAPMLTPDDSQSAKSLSDCEGGFTCRPSSFTPSRYIYVMDSEGTRKLYLD